MHFNVEYTYSENLLFSILLTSLAFDGYLLQVQIYCYIANLRRRCRFLD